MLKNRSYESSAQAFPHEPISVELAEKGPNRPPLDAAADEAASRKLVTNINEATGASFLLILISPLGEIANREVESRGCYKMRFPGELFSDKILLLGVIVLNIGPLVRRDELSDRKGVQNLHKSA